MEKQLEYAKNRYKRVPLDLQKREYEIWQQAADAAGKKLAVFIKLAVREKIANSKTNDTEN